MSISEIKSLIVMARKAEQKKNKCVSKLFDYLSNELELELSQIANNSAENADNLEEAILCHINYGECDLAELLDDIKRAIGE